MTGWERGSLLDGFSVAGIKEVRLGLRWEGEGLDNVAAGVPS